jgi:hypothetical protein
MKTMKRSIIATTLLTSALALMSSMASAVQTNYITNDADYSGGGDVNPNLLPGVKYAATAGRINMGWGGAGGGNLEAYSKGHVDSPGQFKFVYGGTPSIGKVTFTYYDGTAWADRMVLTRDGRLGINLPNTLEPCGDCNLDVNGKIRAEEILVEVSAWPDYVLDKDYKLPPLSEVESFIKQNGHLPNLPTAEQVSANGIALGELTKTMLEKIEELTLHQIQLEKKNKELSEQLALLKNGEK